MGTLSRTPPLHEHASCEFLLNTNCNLNCDYCIARDLRREWMTLEVALRAAKMFLFLARGAKSIEVTYTGGEPLLSFRLMKKITFLLKEMAAEQNTESRFIVKTNGTILTSEIVSFLQANGVHVVVSLDGTPETQNKHRIKKSGHESYDDVLGNARQLLNLGIGCTASMTVHPAAAHTILENVHHLCTLGFMDISVGPTYGTTHWDNESGVSIADSLYSIAALLKNQREREVPLQIGPLYQESEHVGGRLKNTWGCHAGSTNLAFLPDGSISGCSALAMLVPKFPELVIGDVWRGIYDGNLAKLLELAQANIDARPKCQDCATADNCAGGCLAINYATSGVPLEPPNFYCQMLSALPLAWRKAWS